ncbi:MULTISPECIES: hypothetical protein [Polymorphospora]|uniref:Uncharacterized protein n=1 Tax=Polymorphospora lycopeni TaxID=3140240 RepID=A0ABV5CQK8_9ACTN
MSRSPRRRGGLRVVLLAIAAAALVCVLWMAGVAAFRLSIGR